MNIVEAVMEMRTCEVVSLEVINCIADGVESMAAMIVKLQDENDRLKAEKPVTCGECRFWKNEFDHVGICTYCNIDLDHVGYGSCGYGKRRDAE